MSAWRPIPPFINDSCPISVSAQVDPTIQPMPDSITSSSDIWDHTMHLGWIWCMARTYVTNTVLGKTLEPWRTDSQYQQIVSDLMEVETRMPICHRYDTVKFYKRQSQEVKAKQEYWRPWLRVQLIYHSTHTVLNHPFIYLGDSSRTSRFTTSNTFWRKSMDLVLSHATWITRMIELILKFEIETTDPLFANAAALAATVHLYYCCAPSSNLRSQSRKDLAKCLAFVETFVLFSSYCENLVSLASNL